MTPCYICGEPAPDDDDIAFSGMCDECVLDKAENEGKKI